MPKQMQKREALVGVQRTRKATLVKKEDTKESLTFVMVSQQNEGVRYSWDNGYYLERLEIGGANTANLNTFFKDHNRGVDSAIGRVENARIEGTELLADVVFDESGADIKRKFENGTLSDVSIGYTINKYEVEEREGEYDIVRVLDFEVFELSAVGIGFDAGAKFTGRESQLNKGEEKMLKELMARLADLEKKSERTKDENAEVQKLQAQIAGEREKEHERLKVENMELTRKQEIGTIASKYNASDAVRAKFETDGSPQDFMKAILDERAKSQDTVPPTVSSNSVREGMVDAIVMRAGIALKNPSASAERYTGMNLLAMARSITGYDGYDTNELVQRAMVSADFPLLLVNAGNRVLQNTFDEEMATYSQWVTEVERADFKTSTDITLGSAGRLQKVTENGEFKEAQLDENAEEWKLESFGAKFVLTRQMIINDDLGAFNNLLQEFGRMAKRTANGLVYDMLQRVGEYSSYKMADGKPVFDSTHKNIGTAAPLSETSLEEAITNMRKQKDKKGNALNIVPKFLIVAPEQEITARKIINSTASTVSGENSGVVNPFNNSLSIIVDSELAGGAWYVAGSRRTIKVGYLAGTGRRPIVKVNSQSLARTEFEGVFDIGVVAEDFRALQKNAGA